MFFPPILQKIFPFFKDIFYVIGMIVFARMLHLYGSHQNDEEINKNIILIGFFLLFSSIGAYISLYMKYIFKLKPSKQIPPQRWFTVSPFLNFFIVFGIITSVLLFIIGLWPVYRFYGAIFCILAFIVMHQLTTYSPI